MAITFVGSAVNSSSPNADTSVDVSGIDIQAGDLILVAAAVGDTANNGLAAPTEGGYSRVPGVAATLYSNDVNDTNLDLYYKIADGSETTVTLDAVGGTNASNAAVVMVFRGVDNTTPFDVNAVTATGISTSAADPPSINHNNPAGVWTVVAASTGHTGGASATFTFPTNYTTNAAQRAHNDTIDVLVGMGYRTNPADPEDPVAFSAATIGTAADNAWAAVTMALRPAPQVFTLAIDSGSFSLTGTAATLKYNRLMVGGSGAFVLTGTAATIGRLLTLLAGSGSFTLTGQDATLTYEQASGPAPLAADSGSFVLTGQTATLLYNRLLGAQSGSFALTGAAANLRFNHRINVDSGVYLLTGANAALIYDDGSAPVVLVVLSPKWRRRLEQLLGLPTR